MMTSSRRASQLAISLALLVAACGPAAAAIVDLTFDEPGITVGDTITTQYAPAAGFTGAAADVKLASGFNNPFDGLDGQLIHFQTKSSSATATITLAETADFLKFYFRRPSDAGSIALKLFDGANLVVDAGTIGWDPLVTPGWVAFEYLGGDGVYDRVEFFAENKFVIDSVSFGTRPVPLPAPIVLLASAFAGLLRMRRKRARR
jgi:hypothetical protein